jgi:hypothetical protein
MTCVSCGVGWPYIESRSVRYMPCPALRLFAAVRHSQRIECMDGGYYYLRECELLRFSGNNSEGTRISSCRVCREPSSDGGEFRSPCSQPSIYR